MRKFENVRLPDKLDLTYLDGYSWLLNEDYRVLWEEGAKNYQIAVPKDYVTDLSSIPRFARSIIPVVGRQNGPSVVHDFIYEPLDPTITDPNGSHLIGWTKDEADTLFLEAMKAAKVNWYRRNAMYMAVKFFGHRAWRTKSG